MTTIMDPTDERDPVSRRLAERPDEIRGVVGLLDIRKPRGNVLLDRLEELISARLPGVTVRRYTKPTFTKPCPDDLRQQIKSECGFVVEALAD